MNSKLSDEDRDLFRAATSGTRRITTDTVEHKPAPPKPMNRAKTPPEPSAPARRHFSDQFEPHLEENQTRYSLNSSAKQRLRGFKRDNYQPQLIVDLHGFNLKQAKSELDNFVEHCVVSALHYVCVIHGKGEGVLKRQVPLWLAQHPEVIAIDRAPRGWGGEGALVVLIDSLEYGE